MTLLEAVKLELDSLPEDILLAVQEFIGSQKKRGQEMNDTEYLQSIPGMWESIKTGIDAPLSECASLEEVSPKINKPWASILSVAGTSPDFMADYERTKEFDKRIFDK